jgi:hypothetical protein
MTGDGEESKEEEWREKWILSGGAKKVAKKRWEYVLDQVVGCRK